MIPFKATGEKQWTQDSGLKTQTSRVLCLASWVLRLGSCVICLAFVMSPSYSYAHRMLMDCMAEDGTVIVDVLFPNGRPAKNVKVEVYTSDETLYLSGETDAEGQFSFDAGDEAYLKVVATGQLGHRVEQEVSLQEAVPESPEKTEEVSSNGSEVRRRAPIPFREVFAGFGYIFGVAGILMYFKARSDMKKGKARG